MSMRTPGNPRQSGDPAAEPYVPTTYVVRPTPTPGTSADPGERLAQPDDHAHVAAGQPSAAWSEPVPVDGASPSRRADEPNQATSGEVSDAERQIQRTRAEMSQTIDAIHTRLRPQRLMDEAKDKAAEAFDDAKDALRGATIGRVEEMMSDVRYGAQDTGESLLDTIRSNPLPAALAGIGLGMLFMRRGQSSRERNERWNNGRRGWSEDGAYAGSREYARGSAYSASRGSAYRGEDAGDRGMLSQAQQRAGDMADQARETMGDMADTATDFMGTTAERAGEMMGTVTETATRTGSTVWDTVRANPIPAALMTVGAVWMWQQMSPSEDEPEWEGHWSDYDAPGGGYEHRFGSPAYSADGSLLPDTGEMADRVREGAADLGDQAGRMADQAQEQVYRARGQLQRQFYENPLMMGAAAVGIGAAVGLALPSTEPESRLMGEARDNLMERARDTVQEASRKVQRIASEAGDAAKDAAKDEAHAQGLTD